MTPSGGAVHGGERLDAPRQFEVPDGEGAARVMGTHREETVL